MRDVAWIFSVVSPRCRSLLAPRLYGDDIKEMGMTKKVERVMDPRVFMLLAPRVYGDDIKEMGMTLSSLSSASCSHSSCRREPRVYTLLDPRVFMLLAPRVYGDDIKGTGMTRKRHCLV